MEEFKILYVSSEFNNKNGANKSASDVLYSLLQLSNCIHVVTYSNIDNLNKSLFTRELKNKLVWFKVKRKLAFPNTLNLKQILKWLYRKIEDFFSLDFDKIVFNPDLVIVNSIGGHFLLEKLRGLNQATRVNIFRGSPESFGRQSTDISFSLVLSILKTYNCLVFVSDIVRKKCMEYVELENVKDYFIPNCCEEEKVQKIKSKPKSHFRSKLGFSAHSPVAVFVASVQYRKGHDILLKQIPEILKAVPELVFIFIGKKINPYFREIKQIAEDFGIAKKTIFLGEKKNVLEYLYAADLLIFPSRAEAMPRVILEAMLLETGIVSSDVDGIPELIENGTDGLLFPIDQPELLSAAVNRMLTDDGVRESCTKNALSKYWRSFSRDRHVSNYKQLINSLKQTEID